MNKIILVIFSIIVLSLANLQDASAVITVFTDKATFLSNTGASSATGPLPDLGFIAGGAAASQTVGSVTFTITPPSLNFAIGASGTGIPGNDWTLLNPGPDIAISDIENLNADFSAPVFASGFDFVEPTTGNGAGTGFVDTTFSVTLKNGAEIVDSFQFNAPDDVLAFVGVSSDLAFNRVEIRDLTATNDNEYFGEFYTSSIPSSSPVSCGPKTVLNSDNQCIPDLAQVCGQGTIPDFDLLMCFGIALGAVGGELLEISTVSLLVGAIGTNPVITGLVAITMAGVVAQTAWYIHKRKKKVLD